MTHQKVPIWTFTCGNSNNDDVDTLSFSFSSFFENSTSTSIYIHWYCTVEFEQQEEEEEEEELGGCCCAGGGGGGGGGNESNGDNIHDDDDATDDDLQYKVRYEDAINCCWKDFGPNK